MAGARVGFLHRTQRAVGDGDSRRVETIEHTEVAIKRLGATTEIDSRSVTWETPEGNLLRIEARTTMSAQETRSVYTFAGGKVAIEKTVMGTTRKVEMDVPAELPGPAKVEREMRALAGTDGEVLAVTSFMADFEQVMTTTMTSRGSKTLSSRTVRPRNSRA